jgi:hypothetical protein
MSAGRVRSLIAATAIAAVLGYGLSGHGLRQVSHDGMAGAAAGLCMLLAAALVFTAVPRPHAPQTPPLPEAATSALHQRPHPPFDGRARASPSALQRFRN